MLHYEWSHDKKKSPIANQSLLEILFSGISHLYFIIKFFFFFHKKYFNFLFFSQNKSKLVETGLKWCPKLQGCVV